MGGRAKLLEALGGEQGCRRPSAEFYDVHGGSGLDARLEVSDAAAGTSADSRSKSPNEGEAPWSGQENCTAEAANDTICPWAVVPNCWKHWVANRVAGGCRRNFTAASA